MIALSIFFGNFEQNFLTIFLSFVFIHYKAWTTGFLFSNLQCLLVARQSYPWGWSLFFWKVEGIVRTHVTHVWRGHSCVGVTHLWSGHSHVGVTHMCGTSHKSEIFHSLIFMFYFICVVLQVSFAYYLINGIFVVVVFTLQINVDKVSIEWPCGDNLKLEPIGFMFLIFFAIIMILQTVGECWGPLTLTP